MRPAEGDFGKLSRSFQVSEGVKCVMYIAKNPATDVLLPSVCTICVFINRKPVQKLRRPNPRGGPPT